MKSARILSRARIAVAAKAAVTCLGRGREAHLAALRDNRSGLAPCDFLGADLPCYIGRVAGIEDDPFPEALVAYDNRATRLLLAALGTDGFRTQVAEATERWGAERVGAVIGTSTSGVERLERDYRSRQGDEPLSSEYSMRHHSDHHSVTAFLIELLGLAGPGYTVSTACSSSAKAIIDGVQMIQLGLCDAVVAGGVDSLCLTSLYGFDALELVSRQPCRPCDVARDGVSIGEGAGLVLVERDRPGARLLGYGESSDAVSMSTPPPCGEGAALAMRQALDQAGLTPDAIDFIKLHGTATPSNDIAEAVAVEGIFGTQVPVASLKGHIGHTLGAAGSIEAIICLYAMESGVLPGTAGLAERDPGIAIAVQANSAEKTQRRVLSNAFGFGGSNSALVLGAA